jgi:hypothetical protein
MASAKSFSDTAKALAKARFANLAASVSFRSSLRFDVSNDDAS